MAKNKPEATDETASDQPLEIYTNGVNVISSAFEFVLEMGLSTIKLNENPNRPPDADTKVVARIRLSPHHAKAIAALLTQRVIDFERNWGELGMPPELRAIWDTVVNESFTTQKK